MSRSRTTGSSVSNCAASASFIARETAGWACSALERRQGCVIALRHPGAVPGLLHQLERGLKEIHKEPHAAIEPRQFGGRGNARVSAIAHHTSHDGAVLLLDMGLVILAIGPRAGELDMRRLAPALDRLVHEDAVIVRIEAEQRKRQRRAQRGHHFAQQALFAKQQGRAFRPTCRDIGEGQCLHEAATCRRAAVRHKIRLHIAGRGIARVRISPDRNASPHRRGMRVPPTSAPRADSSDRGENPVDRGGADRQQPDAHLAVQRKMPMPLHRRHQERDERLQPLPANPVGRFPEHHQRFSHSLAIHPACRPGSRPVHDMFTPEQSFRVLAMIPRDLRELRQDASLPGSRRGTVSRRHSLQKFVSRSHADPPHACPRTEPLREHF